MTPYHQLASDYARLNQDARAYPLGTFPIPSRPAAAPGAPTVLLFSPHPDDEVIIGGLALRLAREAGWRAINVAVTLGSNKERQPGRLDELKRCCDYIGFGLVQTTPNGLEKINPRSRTQEAGLWSSSVQTIARILTQYQPRLILFPHDQDWNSTHVGTHHLVADALQSLPDGFKCYTAETEFWGQMANPNLMLELSSESLGELITALTFHVGEVRRNPYHLSLPAWMMDNVRRGSELVGGQGGAAPSYPFATLYRLRRWSDGAYQTYYSGGRQLTASQHPAELFP